MAFRIWLYLKSQRGFSYLPLKTQGSKKNTDFKMACIYLFGHIIDSGYGAGVLICLTLIGLAYVMMDGMTSGDRLKFLDGIISLRIWTWLGWISAAVILLIARFLLKQQRESFNRSLKQANEAKEAILKQSELLLENPPAKP